MGNVNFENIELYKNFATKHELALVDEKVDDLIKGSASMATAIEGLTKSVDKISANIETLVTSKAFNAGMHAFIIKCSCVGGTIMLTITTAHWAGIIRIISKYING